MQSTHIQFQDDHLTEWLGYGDFILMSPDGSHNVELKYEGEPPHGDSFHTTFIDGYPLPGFAWGGNFGFSSCYRYITFSWMAKRFERRTIVVDMGARRYFVLPECIDAFAINRPSVLGDTSSKGKRYTFDGTEKWFGY